MRGQTYLYGVKRGAVTELVLVAGGGGGAPAACNAQEPKIRNPARSWTNVDGATSGVPTSDPRPCGKRPHRCNCARYTARGDPAPVVSAGMEVGDGAHARCRPCHGGT